MLVSGFVIQNVAVCQTQLWDIYLCVYIYIYIHSIEIDLKECIKIMGYKLCTRCMPMN